MQKSVEIMSQVEGDAETRAIQAFAKVESAVRHIGRYSSIGFDDPIIHAVLNDMGGWIQFCNCKEGDIPFKANEFLKRYQNRYPRYLPGLYDQNAKFP